MDEEEPKVGRPPLPVGTFGKVTFLDQPGGRVQARAKFRDYDGRVRLVSRVGASKSAAETALKKELRDRQTPAGGVGVRSDTRVSELAATWLAAPHDWSAGTQRTYRSVVHTQIEPALGDLRLREVNAGVVNRALTAISARSGHGAAKTSRSALSGMFCMAVADGAMPRNPVALDTTAGHVCRESLLYDAADPGHAALSTRRLVSSNVPTFRQQAGRASKREMLRRAPWRLIFYMSSGPANPILLPSTWAATRLSKPLSPGGRSATAPSQSSRGRTAAKDRKQLRAAAGRRLGTLPRSRPQTIRSRVRENQHYER